MPSAPNLNPPVSSAAVRAAVHRHGMLAGATRRGKNHDSERGRERAKCVTARTAAEFHRALNRGRKGGVTRGLGEQVGLMVEYGGAVEEISAAASDRHDPKWRRAMAENFFWRHGEDYAKKVSGELIEQSKRGVAHDEERDRAQTEHLTRWQPGAGVSQSERDWAWCRPALRRGLDPAIVRTGLEERRSREKPNPECYARRKVERAAASLAREIPPQNSKPPQVSD